MDTPVNTTSSFDYKRLFELSTDLICIGNFDGYFLDVNPQFCKTLGYTHEELTSRRWMDFIHPDDIAATIERENKLITSGEPILSFVNRYRAKDGSYKHLQWAAARETDSNLVYCVVKDISKQVEVEEKFRHSQEFLHQAQRTAKIGHWMVDLKEMVPRWSEEVYRIHEVSQSHKPSLEEAINYFDEASKPLITEAFTKCVEQGIPYDLQLGFYSTNGTWKWVRTIGQPEYQNGKMTRVFGIFQDISELYQIQKKLMEAKEKAEAGLRAKSTFLSNMSHEIRTPLNAVIGAINLLLDTDPTDHQRELLNITRYSGENLLNLVDDILDLSKIEAGKVELEHRPFDLQARLTSIFQAHKIRMKKNGLSLSMKLNQKLPPLLYGDANRMEQVINNLLGNAIKFTPQGSVQLELRAEKSERGDKLRIDVRVKDTGIGIASDKQELIFGSFEQAESSFHFGGTGLGLAISRNLIEKMGGKLWVKSELGKGSTFGFTIELKIARKAQKVFPSLKQGAMNCENELEGLKVLVVEDNEINAEIISLFLQKKGIKVTHALDGEIGLKMAEQESFDLILMDLQMPNMDGKEATEKIRIFDSETPIVALTASAPFEEINKLKEIGFNDLVSKPFKPERFWEVITAYTRTFKVQL